MRRVFHTVLGAIFIGMGVPLAITSLFVLVRYGDVIVLLATVGSALLTIMGVRLVTNPYDVRFDQKGMHLAFLFRNESIAWEQVNCYKKRSPVGWMWRMKRTQMEAAIPIVLHYQRIVRGRPRPARVRIGVPGYGQPPILWSARHFETPLDRYIPEKNRTRWATKRPHGNAGP